jgi:TRAP-type mannitol/chloroaromatic compound transport system substrate-binding protein
MVEKIIGSMTIDELVELLKGGGIDAVEVVNGDDEVVEFGIKHVSSVYFRNKTWFDGSNAEKTALQLVFALKSH